MVDLTKEEIIEIYGGKERDNLEAVVTVLDGAIGGIVGVIAGWLDK